MHHLESLRALSFEKEHIEANSDASVRLCTF